MVCRKNHRRLVLAKKSVRSEQSLEDGLRSLRIKPTEDVVKNEQALLSIDGASQGLATIRDHLSTRFPGQEHSQRVVSARRSEPLLLSQQWSDLSAERRNNPRPEHMLE